MGGAAFGTEDFARSGSGSFLTGVAFNDRDGDHFYDPGEGLGGLTVDAVDAAGHHFTTTTSDAGGYNLNLAPGSYTVTFENANRATTTQNVVIGDLNVKLDALNPVFELLA